MLAWFQANLAALSPRYRRLLAIALGLCVLVVLNRTILRWALQYESDLGSQLEDLKSKLEKLQEKRSSRPELAAQRQALLVRLQEEDSLVLPYDTPNEAQNRLSECLQALARRSGIELTNTLPQPLVDLGEHHQRVQVLARMNALTQHWTRFLYEIEALRDAEPRDDPTDPGCPPLPLTVDELTVRISGGKGQHELTLAFKISGIIRKPAALESGAGASEEPRVPRGRN